MSLYAESKGPHKGKVYGYMCAIDWECELGGASGGNRIYPSANDIKHCAPTCAENCGVVKVAVEFVRTVKKAKRDT